MFEDLISARAASPLLASLTSHTPTETARISAQFPGVPDDYLQFLQRLGSGEIGVGKYTLYGGLVPPEEIYGELPPELEHLVLLGDDMQGYCAGFDTRTWQVVEVDPTTMEPNPVADTFEKFIRQRIAL
jgi:hypothetical protein